MRWISTVIFFLSLNSVFAQSRFNLLPADKDGKWGYINSEGVWKINPKFDLCLPFNSSPYTWASNGTGSFLIDTLGNVVAPLQFNEVADLQNDIIIYRKEGFYGWYNIAQKSTIDAVYDAVSFSPDPEILIIKDSLFGMADVNNVIIVPTLYHGIKQVGKYFEACKSGNCVVYSRTGELIIKTRHVEYDIGSEIIFAKQKDGIQTDLYAPNGDSLTSVRMQYSNYLGRGFYSIHNHDSVTIYDAGSRRIIYESKGTIQPSGTDWFLVGHDSTFGIFSTIKKRFIIPIEFSAIRLLEDSSRFVAVLNQSGYAIFNTDGKRITNNEFDWARPEYSWGSIPVRKNGFWGLIDSNGKQLLPCRYNDITSGDDRVVKARTDSTAILYEFNSTLTITDSLVFSNVSSIALTGVIGSSEMVSNGGASPIRRTSINNVTPNELWFRDSKKKWGLKDSSGRTIIQPVFDELEKVAGTEYVIGKVNVRRDIMYGDVDAHFYGVYALIDEVRFRTLIQPKALYIDVKNIRDADMPSIRVLFTNGFFATVNKSNGMVKWYGSKYITPYSGGYAAVFVGERMTSLPEEKNEYVSKNPYYRKCVVISPTELTSQLKAQCSRYGKSARGYTIFGDGYWAFIDINGNFIKTREEFKHLRIAELGDIRNNSMIIRTLDSTYGVWSFKDNFLIPPVYKKIVYLPHTNYKLYKVTSSQSLFGFASLNGKMICSPMFEETQTFKNGRAWAVINNHLVMVDQQGKVMVADSGLQTDDNYRLRYAVPYSDGIAAVRLGRGYAMIDSNYKQLGKTLYRKLDVFSDGLIPVRPMGEKYYGYMDSDGAIVISPIYARVQPFSNGYALVRPQGKNSRYGYITTNGRVISKFMYSRGEPFNKEGFAEVRKGSSRGILNTQGKHVVPVKFQKIWFGEDRFVARKSRSVFIYDRMGEKVKKIKGHVSQGFLNGVLIVSRNGKHYLYNTQGLPVNKIEFSHIEPFENDLTVSYNKNTTYVLNKNCDTLNSFAGKPLSGFRNGFVLMRTTSGVEFLNEKGQNLFNATFQFAEPFENGFALVQINNQFGIIDTNGFMVIPPFFDWISKPAENICTVSNHTLNGVADSTGRFIVPPECQDIYFESSQKVFRYRRNNHMGYFRTDGTLIKVAE
ncbi:MAG: hypothetical protein GC181_11205 [Bacteroidetes bacterium]|nr:hypothetical protein [Bacteroidota bacterium]